MKNQNLQTEDRILFQGDSITDAFRKPEEINEAYQLGNGYVFLIAAHLRLAQPTAGYVFFNRGICGNRIANLVERWDADCLALRPTVVSLLVGINDTAHDVGGKPGASLAEYVHDYRKLLDWTRRELPAVRLVLCEPFALCAGRVTPAWRENLRPRQEAIRQLARECQAVFVPLQQPFDDACAHAPAAYWIYDGIHPTAAGFGLIAREWLAAVEPE